MDTGRKDAELAALKRAVSAHQPASPIQAGHRRPGPSGVSPTPFVLLGMVIVAVLALGVTRVLWLFTP